MEIRRFSREQLLAAGGEGLWGLGEGTATEPPAPAVTATRAAALGLQTRCRGWAGERGPEEPEGRWF